MITAPFVERIFEVDGQHVLCRFFKPEADRGDFTCLFTVDWPEERISRHIHGVDEVQALLLAMQTAHAYLLAARNNQGRKVSWLGEPRLGLPIADVMRDWESDGSPPGAPPDS